MNTTLATPTDSTSGIGSLAPDFKLKASNGKEIRLSDYRGRNHVILFFVREYI